MTSPRGTRNLEENPRERRAPALAHQFDSRPLQDRGRPDGGKEPPVSLRSLLELCLETVRPLVRANAIELVRELEAAPLTLVSDEEKLKQIIINLLSNAAKFTATGSIVLTASERDGTVQIRVRDTGIGIPADKLRSFYRGVPPARRRHGTGTGPTRHWARSVDQPPAGAPPRRRNHRCEQGRSRIKSLILTLPLQQDALPALPRPAMGVQPVPLRAAVLTTEDLSAAELATLRARVRAIIGKHDLDREALVREISADARGH